MSEYIISIKDIAILLAKFNGTELVDKDGAPICDQGEIAKSIDEPIVLKELVRCRDCEFEMNGYCSHPDTTNDDLWFPVEPDGFCAWGERHEP